MLRRDQRGTPVENNLPFMPLLIRRATDYLDIMSYISTGKKHGVSAYEALTAAFAGNAEIVLQ